MLCFLLIFFYICFFCYFALCLSDPNTLCILSGHSAVEQHSQLAGFRYSLSLGSFNSLCNVVTKHLGRFAYNIVIQRHTEKPPLLCTLPLLHPSVPFLCPPLHSCCFGGSSAVFTVFNTWSHLVRVVLCCVHSFLACAASNTPRRRKNKTEQI